MEKVDDAPQLAETTNMVPGKRSRKETTTVMKAVGAGSGDRDEDSSEDEIIRKVESKEAASLVHQQSLMHLGDDGEELPAGFGDDEDSEDGDDVFGRQVLAGGPVSSAPTESEDGGDEMYRVGEGQDPKEGAAMFDRQESLVFKKAEIQQLDSGSNERQGR